MSDELKHEIIESLELIVTKLDHAIAILTPTNETTNESGETMINVLDIRTEESKLLTTSKPIDEMTEQEIIEEAKRNKEFALNVMNNYV